MATFDLLEEWKNFKLTSEEEETAIDVDASAPATTGSRLEQILVGKLFIKRPITCPVMKNTMRTAWKLENNAFEVQSLGYNLFLFSFARALDRNKIYKSGPWTFDRTLVLINKPVALIPPSELDFTKLPIWVRFFDLPLGCITRDMAIRLGNALGGFEEADCDDLNPDWGSNLRVRVMLDISKPLRRGIKLNLDGPIGGAWIPIQYERLPDFCYHCGKLDHTLKDCDECFSDAGLSSSRKKHQYGSWLRYQGTVKPTMPQMKQPQEDLLDKSGNNSFSSSTSPVGAGSQGVQSAPATGPIAIPMESPVTETPKKGAVTNAGVFNST